MEKIPIAPLITPGEGAPEKRERLVFRAGISPTESNKKIGPVRSHLYNYAFAKSEAWKGKDSTIIFRVDDTNKKKHTREKAEDLFRFFSDTLGFHFDITPENAEKETGQSVFQSERQEIYRRYVEELFDKQVAFLDKDSGLVLFDIKKFIDEYADTLEIKDLLRGTIKFKLEENLRHGQKFFPLLRSDTSALYHLTSVVDDETFGVTHVVRGEDKLSIAEFQEMVRVALGFEPKRYLHTPMLLDTDGKLLKGTVKFDDFIKQGIVPHALISYMISSGYGNPEKLYPSMDTFIRGFDHTKIHKNSGKFDPKRLEDINGKLLRKISPEVYISSIVLYLSKCGEDRLIEILKSDQGLQKILIVLRREPGESAQIMKSIIEPQFEPIREDDRAVTQQVISELEKDTETMPSAKTLGLDQKAVYDSIRWILVGKYTFPNIAHVFEYLKDNKMLNQRVAFAKKILMDTLPQ
ncbi:MAG: glutamate--tRNA ligase family protein [Candidatus Uhrbacteria bacterium]|nr:glutamate--tRNA ligase family protein [Candidatus Uhrbacteria bacterium]